jgi:hypothetical protein
LAQEEKKIMPRAKPTDADYETILSEVFIEHSRMDFVEHFCLIERASAKVEARFSRRAIRMRDIHPAIMAALKRLEAAGRIKTFNVLVGYTPRHGGRGLVYSLSQNRELVIDQPDLDDERDH